MFINTGKLRIELVGFPHKALGNRYWEFTPKYMDMILSMFEGYEYEFVTEKPDIRLFNVFRKT